MKRPWGSMYKIVSTKHFWLKFLFVRGRTSLQSHRERDEWHLGFYKVKAGEKHRLYRGAYAELALGNPREDDVVRYEDDYGRIEDVVVAVSGGFDPLHVGHTKLFEEAKKLGDKLVVIINNDNWLKKKKGYVFMPQYERKAVIESLACVDQVMLTEHPENLGDMSVSQELRVLKPNIFANGGDRKQDDIPEIAVCNEIGCKMLFNVGGEKVQSSSLLLANYKEVTSGKIAMRTA